MSLMPSLCAALERAGGERLVMRAGERPHVLIKGRRQDVATAVLSVNAVEALVDQILSMDGRRDLSEKGSVEETLNTPSFPHPLTARAERVGDDFCVELIVKVPEAAPVPEPEMAPPPPPETASFEQNPVMSYSPVEPEPHMDQPVALPEPEPELAPEPIQARMPEVSSAPSHPPVRVVARVEERGASARQTGGRLDLHGWMSRAFERGATMLYLRAGAPASARVNDRIEPLGEDLVDVSVLNDTGDIFSRGGDGLWQSHADGEWVRELADLGHVGCRVFSDHRGQGLIVQLRPRTSPKLLHKYIPRQVRTACEGDGLIVVSAPTEADAESLSNAIADWSGRARGGYLIALQRRNGRGELAGAFVSQRTVTGSDADFAAAIRRATHESPDIMLVTGPQSELPLHEAILAASNGRLVIVAVVAPTSVQAMRTLLGQTGFDREAHVRRALSASFRVAVGYRSLKRIGGGRMLIQDVVLASPEVRTLVEGGDFDGLTRTVRDGVAGTRSVDEALARAVTRRQISLREAATQAVDKRHMVALVRMQARAQNSRAKAHAPRPDREIHVPIAIDDDRYGAAAGGMRSRS